MSVVSVNIAATNVEGALFGVFFALSVSSLCLLTNRRWKEVEASATHPTSWAVAFRGMWRSTLFVASLFFIAIITAVMSSLILRVRVLKGGALQHWCIGVRRSFDAFMYYDGGQNPTEYYLDLRHPLEVARTALLVFTLLIGDVVLVHRMWIVWNRDARMAILPAITSAGLLSSGIGVLYQFSTNAPTDTVFAKKVTDWIIGVVVCTLITKIYGTAMIACRMFVVTRSLRGTGLRNSGRSMLEVLMIFIESSTLSTAWTIFFAIAYASKSALQSFPTSCSPAINGIAFMLITVRVGLGWDLQLNVTGPEEGPQPATLAPFQSYPLRAIRLTVTRAVEQETDYAISNDSRKQNDLEEPVLAIGKV